MQKTREQEGTAAISSATQILPLVRRRMIVAWTKGAFIAGVLAASLYWLTGSARLFYVAPPLFIFAALLAFARQYIPISKKHDELVCEYGDIYVKEVAAAIDEHGIRTLLRTRWFETYADKGCKRSSST